MANNSRQNHYQAVLAGRFSPSEIDDGLMQPAGIDNLNQDPIVSAVRISMPPRLGHNLLAMLAPRVPALPCTLIRTPVLHGMSSSYP